MLIGGLTFSAAVTVVTGLIVKSHARMDKAEIATYVAIIAWGAFVWGMILIRHSA